MEKKSLQIANAYALPLGTILFGPLADMISVQTIMIGNGIATVLFALAAVKIGGFTKEQSELYF